MENKYYKYYPQVFLAECSEKFKKGDVIKIVTRRGKVNEHIIHNLIFERGGKFYYSITRADGFNSQERAKRKKERYQQWEESAIKRSEEWREKSNEGAEFLRLGEPIKIGHHSEKSHRALIERNWRRMENRFNELDKADLHNQKAEYWEKQAGKIDLSMLESLEYFKFKSEEATKKHQFLLDNPSKREHAYSLTYAKKQANEMKEKLEIAKRLWGDF